MSGVAAVVVNHDGASHLPGCLRSLERQTRELDRVVVVDNASGDGSCGVLEDERRRWGDRLTVLANDVNRGYAGGANDGIRATGTPVVVVANFDVRLDPGFVEAAVDRLSRDPRCGAVQGRLHRLRPAPDGGAVIDTTGHVATRTRLFRNRGGGEIDRGQYHRPGPVFGVSGALAVYRREMLEDVALPRPGGDREIFDEELFAYYEDVDLDWRAALRGWGATYEPDAVARHERGGAGPRRTPLVERLNWRNRLLCVLKNDDLGALGRALPEVALTTALKTGELAVTVPGALLAAVGDLRLARAMLHKRRLVGERALVPRRAVVDRWFGPLDYRSWAATWWRRRRGVPPGA